MLGIRGCLLNEWIAKKSFKNSFFFLKDIQDLLQSIYKISLCAVLIIWLIINPAALDSPGLDYTFVRENGSSNLQVF